MYLIDNFIISFLTIITAIGLLLAALISLKNNFIKFLMIIEALFGFLIFLLILISFLIDNAQGNLFAFYLLILLALESALGLSLYLRYSWL